MLNGNSYGLVNVFDLSLGKALFPLSITHFFLVKRMNMEPVIIAIVTKTIIRPEGIVARLFRSSPFIPYILATNVSGNKIDANIVSVLIVSFISKEMFAMYRSLIELIVSR